MIKPVTFQGCFNFNANLYALEVRSRFIDQSKRILQGLRQRTCRANRRSKNTNRHGRVFGARSYVRNHGGGISRPANF